MMKLSPFFGGKHGQVFILFAFMAAMQQLFRFDPLPTNHRLQASSESRFIAYAYFFKAQMLGEGSVAFRRPQWTVRERKQALNELDRALLWMPDSDYPLFLVLHFWSGWGGRDAQKQVVNWAVDYAKKDLSHRWRWIVQAVWCARYQWHDMSMAYAYASLLRYHSDVPAWAQSLGVWVAESQHDYHTAATWIGALLANGMIKDPSELAFLEKRLILLKQAAAEQNRVR